MGVSYAGRLSAARWIERCAGWAVYSYEIREGKSTSFASGSVLSLIWKPFACNWSVTQVTHFKNITVEKEGLRSTVKSGISFTGSDSNPSCHILQTGCRTGAGRLIKTSCRTGAGRLVKTYCCSSTRFESHGKHLHFTNFILWWHCKQLLTVLKLYRSLRKTCSEKRCKTPP